MMHCQCTEAVEAKATPATMKRFTTLTVRLIKRYLSTRKQQWSKPSSPGCLKSTSRCMCLHMRTGGKSWRERWCTAEMERFKIQKTIEDTRN